MVSKHYKKIPFSKLYPPHNRLIHLGVSLFQCSGISFLPTPEAFFLFKSGVSLNSSFPSEPLAINLYPTDSRTHCSRTGGAESKLSWSPQSGRWRAEVCARLSLTTATSLLTLLRLQKNKKIILEVHNYGKTSLSGTE